MKQRQRGMPADHIGVLLAAFGLALGGWVGIGLLVTTRPPSIGVELWMFFLLLQLAVTGTIVPFVRYFNVRFSEVPPPGGVIVRQSTWLGLFAVVCVWLQIQRGLSIPIAFFLGLVFVVLEIFLRVRELNSDEYD